MAKKINFRNGYVNIDLSDIIKHLDTLPTIASSSATGGKIESDYFDKLVKELSEDVKIKKPVMAIVNAFSITDGTHTLSGAVNDYATIGTLVETSTTYIITIQGGLYYDSTIKYFGRFIIYKTNRDITISYN